MLARDPPNIGLATRGAGGTNFGPRLRASSANFGARTPGATLAPGIGALPDAPPVLLPFQAPLQVSCAPKLRAASAGAPPPVSESHWLTTLDCTEILSGLLFTTIAGLRLYTVPAHPPWQEPRRRGCHLVFGARSETWGAHDVVGAFGLASERLHGSTKQSNHGKLGFGASRETGNYM